MDHPPASPSQLQARPQQASMSRPASASASASASAPAPASVSAPVSSAGPAALTAATLPNNNTITPPPPAPASPFPQSSPCATAPDQTRQAQGRPPPSQLAAPPPPPPPPVSQDSCSQLPGSPLQAQKLSHCRTHVLLQKSDPPRSQTESQPRNQIQAHARSQSLPQSTAITGKGIENGNNGTGKECICSSANTHDTGVVNAPGPNTARQPCLCGPSFLPSVAAVPGPADLVSRHPQQSPFRPGSYSKAPSTTTAYPTTYAHPPRLAPAPAPSHQNGCHRGPVSPNRVTPGVSSPTSSMSNLPAPGGPTRQQPPQHAVPPPPSVGYPNPSHYPPQGMPGHAPQYGYPPPSASPVDQYRHSSAGAPPNPLALPSMRSLEPAQQPQQPPLVQHHAHYPPQYAQPGAPIGSTMAPGPPPNMGYYAIHPQPYNMHDPMAARYGLPPGLYGDPRMQLSGGRHKKEIKRRTKTGCLTCRKRRIKCDETHPTCNNCKKSKRACMGYDPIFKQQAGGVTAAGASAAIQPAAPTGQPSAAATSTVPAAASTPYTTHPTPTLTPSNPNPPILTPDLPEAATSLKAEPQQTSSYIDPALESPGPASLISLAPDQASDQNNGVGILNLRGGGSPFSSPALSSTPSSAPLQPSLPSAHAYSTVPVKTMKVDELIALGGAAPPASNAPPAREAIEEVTKIYYEIYVPGLCQFFESQWYNFKSQGSNPVAVFLNNKPLLSLFADFVSTLHSVSPANPSQVTYSGNLETRLVWALTMLPYLTPVGQNLPRDDPLPQDDAIEVRNRLRVFEALLTNEPLLCNPLIPAPRNADTIRRKEFEFWHALAEFVRCPDPVERETSLGRLRGLLDGRENRDVLYSLAVLRQFSPLFEPGYEDKIPDHLDETEPRNKLHVATQFIKAEASPTGGTTNVVRRFASLAIKALVSPGVNIVRKRP